VNAKPPLDFLVYLHLLARYGWSRQQVDAMPAERIAMLLSRADDAPDSRRKDTSP
jgi:hypothetical protein